jgi:geranylgeranyl diphosphate synthase type I
MVDPQEDIIQIYLTAIEEELQDAVKRTSQSGNTQLYDMLAYHMGWLDKPINSEAHGKRLRPLLVLLTCSAAGGDWKHALPAAAAVELVHNFSLIHDDIEDRSPIRRGRPTIWKKWGIPLAINAGDAMFTLAHLQILRLIQSLPESATLQAVKILQQACLHLTQGQHLDLAYEKRSNITLDDYWFMVEGKTAALITASTELGALAALCDSQTCKSYRSFGRMLGLAFQVQDDLLGIWGNSALTGKSSQSDLMTRKKTLPILYGLSKSGQFAECWNQKPLPTGDAQELINLLEVDGAKTFTQSSANELINQALIELDNAHPTGSSGQLLKEMALSLIHRQV